MHILYVILAHTISQRGGGIIFPKKGPDPLPPWKVRDPGKLFGGMGGDQGSYSDRSLPAFSLCSICKRLLICLHTTCIVFPPSLFLARFFLVFSSKTCSE